MKKKAVVGSIAALVLGMSLCSYQLGRYQATEEQRNRVSYIEDSQKEESLVAEQLTPEQVSAKENIDAEQIVVKITDQGYVTSHGDHFHYYNGKVPFEAIFSEELIMKDPTYVLQDGHIINEVQDGYVIKVDGKYYLYLKDAKQQKNVRSKEEVERQKGITSADSKHQATGARRSDGPYKTDDGYIFHPTDVIEDTGDGFIVPHGDHFHFIPKKDLSASELKAAQDYWNKKGNSQSTTGNHYVSRHQKVQQETPVSVQGQDLASLLAQLDATPLSQRHVEADGLVFDPRTITKKTAAGVIVPHGDHHHFIPYSQMSALEEKISRMIGVGGGVVSAPRQNVQVGGVTNSTHSMILIDSVEPIQSSHSTDIPIAGQGKDRVISYMGRPIAVYGKGLDGKAYFTSDGYIFSKDSITSVDEHSLIASHGDHFHYVDLGELEDFEIKQVEEWVKEQSGKSIVAKDHGQVGKNERNDKVVQQPAILLAQNQDLASLLAQLDTTPLSQRHVEADGLVFDPRTISKKTATGVIVPHGDHFHFIPYSQMSALEEKIARMIGTSGASIGQANGGSRHQATSHQVHSNPTPSPTLPISPTKPTGTAKQQTRMWQGRPIAVYGKGLDGKAYFTSDGYQFSKASITSVDEHGLIASHGDHFHYVGFGELEAFELKEVAAWLAEKSQANAGSHSTAAPSKPVIPPATEGQESSENRPEFDSQAVLRKASHQGQVGYWMEVDGKAYFYARQELDLMKISFAELRLMEKDPSYLFDVSPAKEGDLTPAPLVPIHKLPMRGGNATYDTGEVFVIPHIDHIHVLPYTWLNKEQIATIKYLMRHPEVRPAAWTSSGHSHDEAADQLAPILNATAPDKRAGLKNWQIVHTAEEVGAARAQGRFATADGYIFAAEDVLDPRSFVFRDAFSLPRADDDSLRSVKKSELSSQELAAVQALLDKRDRDELAKRVTPQEQRKGLKNWQIVHSYEEIEAVKAAGKFTTKDGYIFDPQDVVDPKTKVSQTAFRIPRPDGSGFYRVEKAALHPQTELAPAEALLAATQPAPAQPAKPTESTTQPSTSSIIATPAQRFTPEETREKSGTPTSNQAQESKSESTPSSTSPSDAEPVAKPASEEAASEPAVADEPVPVLTDVAGSKPEKALDSVSETDAAESKPEKALDSVSE
ncbi:TPA: pneumococcal-type histidine triad protein [Streptococcus suis]|nr:pneumococcal-type histidine triad protein [Streptococcus suis]